MSPIQKDHLQPIVGEQKPDMMGAKSGPKTVAWSRWLLLSARAEKVCSDNDVGSHKSRAYSKVGRHCSSARAVFAIDVCHDACYQRNGRTGKHPDKQPEDEEGWPVWCQCTSQCP